MESDNLDLVKKWVPYLSGIIIIGGLLYLLFFYLTFGIEIAQYMDLSDCLLLRLDNFVYYILFVGICYLLTYLEFKINAKKGPDTPNAGNRKTSTLSKPTLLSNQFAPTHCLLLTVYCTYWFDGYTSTILTWAGILFTAVLFLLTLFTLKKYFFQNGLNKKKKNHFRNTLVIRLAFLYFAYMSFLGFSNANVLKTGASRTKAEFKLTLKPNEVLNNSDSLIFVGKIKNYYFLYNPKSKTKTIVPTSEVLQCEMNTITYLDKSDSCACVCFLP